jgi:release factor glutamine methyltransferase
MTDYPDSDRLLAQAERAIERRDAEILLAHSWALTRAQLLARAREPVPADVVARFSESCARRAAGVPVAYLLGRREFWSLPFEVSPAALVPRPETELLVERVLHRVHVPLAEVADLGTGSGAIAIAIAHERPAWRVTATDSSSAALELAQRNAQRLANGRIEFLSGDWYSPLAARRFDAVASNPPYIASDDPALHDDGVRHEPRCALSPGADALSALAILINGAPYHLKPGGWLLLEHGAAQGPAVRATLVARGFAHVTSHRDLAGHERVSEAQWPSS